jgi:hypothetical protein
VAESVSAKSYGELLAPARTVRQQKGLEPTDWPMSAESPVGPAVFVHSIGRGRVVTITSSPDVATAGVHHIPEARKLLRHAIDFLHPHARVEVTASVTVETVITDDPRARTLRVHFIPYHSPPQTLPPQGRPFVMPGLIEDIPIFRAEIKLRDPFESARAFRAPLEVDRDRRTIRFMAEDIHEVVAIQY